MPNNQTTFFSSVRTKTSLKNEVQEVLSSLWLTWGTFVNNAAKKLVAERKVVFEERDENGFTPEKAKELKDAYEDSKKWIWVTPSMTVNEAQDYLTRLK